MPYFYIDTKSKVSSAKFVNFYLDQLSISSAFRKFVIAAQLSSLALQSGRSQGFSFIMHEALAPRQNAHNFKFVTHKRLTTADC